MLPTVLFLFFGVFNLLLNTQSNALSYEVNKLTALDGTVTQAMVATRSRPERFSVLFNLSPLSASLSLSDTVSDSHDFGPRRDLELPQNAVKLQPGDDINAVIAQHPPGSTFLLGAGVYRMQSVTLRDGDVLMGEYGAELNGSRLVTEVSREGDYWVLPEQTQQGKVFDKCFPEFPACKYPEQVFIDDRLLSQVESLQQLRSGTFYFDYRNDKIYLADNPEDKKLEVSVTPQAIEGAPNAVISNLIITKYAQSGDWMTVRSFPDMVVQYNDVGFNASIGLSLSHRVHAHHNRIHHSGRLGVIDVQSHDVKFEYNELAFNNTFGYDYNWEAGGSKFLETRNMLIAHNYVHHNFGPGLWTDYDNQDTLYEYNKVISNTASGIFHEVSGSAEIRFNEINHNGTNGIEISNSSDTDVYRNILKGNASSLWAKNACRPAAETFTLKNVHFYDNEVHQDAHYAGEGDWLVGKAAALYAERSCRHWREDFSDWFNTVGNRWTDNTYHFTNLRDGARPPFFWQEAELQLDAWQDFGLQ